MKQQTHKRVISLKDVRLASTSGHIIPLEARVPTEIPEPLFLEASKQGCIDYNAQTIQTLKETLAALESDEEIQSLSDPRNIIKEAVKTVMIFGTPEAFTAEGVPKVLAVKASIESDSPLPIPVDRELVYDLYLELEGTAVEVAAPNTRDEKADNLGDGRVKDNLGLDSETSNELSDQLSAATQRAGGDYASEE